MLLFPKKKWETIYSVLNCVKLHSSWIAFYIRNKFFRSCWEIEDNMMLRVLYSNNSIGVLKKNSRAVVCVIESFNLIFGIVRNTCSLCFGCEISFYYRLAARRCNYFLFLWDLFLGHCQLFYIYVKFRWISILFLWCELM